MIINEGLSSLIRMSNYLALHASYVQGGGGNTSIKLNDGRMLIKASGLSLSKVSHDFGYASVDFRKIREYLLNSNIDEDAFSSKVMRLNTIKTFRPSMETGFHAALGDCVLHSHSVYANVLNCSVEGVSIIKRLFPNACFIEYVAPGLSLSAEINTNRKNNIFFLQNHGIIVSSSTAEDVIELHEYLNAKIISELNLPTLNNKSHPDSDTVTMTERVLFPDQVIYMNPKSKFLGSTAQNEIINAHAYIHEQISKLGLTVKYLNKTDVAFLTEMGAEKYRSQVDVG